MVSITLSVPSDLKTEMDCFREINWSEVAREAIKKKVVLLKQFREFTKDSTLTGEDALKLSKEVNKKLAKKLAGARNN